MNKLHVIFQNPHLPLLKFTKMYFVERLITTIKFTDSYRHYMYNEKVMKRMVRYHLLISNFNK